MIRLSNIIAEISLSQVQPYATQFVWTRIGSDDSTTFECDFDADGQPVKMQMDQDATDDWAFSYMVKAAPGAIGMWTVSAGMGTARGHVDVFRLFKTLGYAIRDFADTHVGVDVINITGFDNSGDIKSRQKSRIYRSFIEANPELSAFRVQEYRGELYLVRKMSGQRRPDSTGVEDA